MTLKNEVLDSSTIEQRQMDEYLVEVDRHEQEINSRIQEYQDSIDRFREELELDIWLEECMLWQIQNED